MFIYMHLAHNNDLCESHDYDRPNETRLTKNNPITRLIMVRLTTFFIP